MKELYYLDFYSYIIYFIYKPSGRLCYLGRSEFLRVKDSEVFYISQ